MFKNIKIAIRIIICYLLIMVIGLGITNVFFSTIKNGLGEMIGLSITQLLSSGYIVYMVKKFYGWNNVGFNKINTKNMIWFVPYMLILAAMMCIFIKGFYQNITLVDKEIWTVLIITFIGTLPAGFSFVALAIKLNNIWPIIIFHVLWNFILMASPVIGIDVSVASIICNPLNIVIAIILWIIIIIEQRRNRKLIFSRK